jgi:hypothetical protein
MQLATPDPSSPPTSLVVAVVVCGVVYIGMYVWYGWALSRLFPTLGSRAARGWIPVVNDAEIFTLGGVPGRSVALCFIPLVNIYALVLRIRATSRINSAYGRGGGMTALAVVVPPLWATILATSQPLSVAGRFEPTMAQDSAPGGTQIPAPMPRASETEPAAEPPSSTPPQEPESAGVHLRTPVSPYLGRPSQRLVPAAVVGVPSPPPPSAPEPAPEPAETVPHIPRAPWLPRTPPDQAPAADGGDDAIGDDDEADGETIVVARRANTPWRLRVEGVGEFPLAGDHVLLGRKPPMARGTQAVRIHDTTRTLSKVHARLDLVDGDWVITDLNSTNGVIITASDGTERLLAVGEAATVPFSFTLGRLAMAITFEEPSA